MPGDRIRSYHYDGLVEDVQWRELVPQLRDWVRGCMEDPNLGELHLFYRGPVAAAPLIGAVAVGRKPLCVYSYDEEFSVYRFAYRVDRRLLQGA